ncbi:hypothetical protein J6590_015336 [Homalodisca vitripennis]|nr:hypothetical protein J6590_015336 [Homalodisca vitripennis]
MSPTVLLQSSLMAEHYCQLSVPTFSFVSILRTKSNSSVMSTAKCLVAWDRTESDVELSSLYNRATLNTQKSHSVSPKTVSSGFREDYIDSSSRVLHFIHLKLHLFRSRLKKRD